MSTARNYMNSQKNIYLKNLDKELNTTINIGHLADSSKFGMSTINKI